MRHALVLVVGMSLFSGSAFAGDFLVTPHIGYNFGGITGQFCGQPGANLVECTPKRLNIGGSAAITFGVFGVEEELTYGPHVLGFSQTAGDCVSCFGGADNVNDVTTVMTNVLFRRAFGRVEPYLKAGVGTLTVKVLPDVPSHTGLGFDAGGGATIFVSRHVGFTGEYRYFRGRDNFSINGQPIGFSTFSTGPVFRF